MPVARLATRYELLILHATTPDGDVFVLPDGDTTYRFRDVPADDEAGDDVPADDEAADDDLTAAAQALATRLRAAQPEGEPAAEAVIPQPRRPETAPAD